MVSFLRSICSTCVLAVLGVLLIPGIREGHRAEAQVIRSAEGMRTNLQVGFRYVALRPAGRLVATETAAARMLPAGGLGVELELGDHDWPVGIRATVDRFWTSRMEFRAHDCDSYAGACAVETERRLRFLAVGPVVRPRARTANVQPFAAVGVGLIHYAPLWQVRCIGSLMQLPSLSCYGYSWGTGRWHTAFSFGGGMDVRIGHGLLTASLSGVASSYSVETITATGHTVDRRYLVNWMPALGMRVGFF